MSSNTNYSNRALSLDLLEQAAKWRIALEEGTAGAEDFERWLKDGEEHHQAFKMIEAGWNSIDAHASHPDMTALLQAASARTSTETYQQERQANWLRSTGWIALATAASVLLVFIITFARTESYETTPGEQREVVLADGSAIVLDADTRVVVNYSSHSRTLDIERGQARFNVAHDLARPFLVNAYNVTVRATGTAFNVDLVGNNTRVTLLDGRVVVRIAEGEHRDPSPSVTTQAVELLPNQQLIAAHHSHELRVVSSDGKLTQAWQEGKLIFRDEPLSDAVDRMNRYAHKKIAIIDEQILRTRVSGIFGIRDASAFVEALTVYLPITAVEHENTIELHMREAS